MIRKNTRLFASAVGILLLGLGARAEDQKRQEAEVRESFKKLAAAVKDDKYEEAARWIAPTADKVWSNFVVFRSAAMKYQQAFEKRFGKGEPAHFQLQKIGKKGDLAEHLYETAGMIQYVKFPRKDQAHVRAWTRRPDWRKKSETALFERTFTAIKVGDKWKFQLHTFGGTPVVKKVKRKALDGKAVEVYAEHYPKNVTKESTWIELEPIIYEDREKILKLEAEMWAKMAKTLQAQSEQVQKKTYKNAERSRRSPGAGDLHSR